MTRPLEVVAHIEAALVSGGFRVSRDSVGARQVVIGRSGRIGRPTFVLVGVFKAGMASREQLERYADEARQYSSTVKGRLSAGATAVAVAVVEAGGRDESGDWAGRVPTRGAAFPVLVDLSAGRVTCPDEPKELLRLVEDRVAPSVRMV